MIPKLHLSLLCARLSQSRKLLFLFLASSVLCGSLPAAEPKDNFGLGGGTGGPEGEKAGAVEFRKLRISAPQ
jgi:hypothetical protein